MCKLCETKPVYEFTNQRKLCKTCFVRWFQKKVLYTIRKFEMISKHHGRTPKDFQRKSLLRAMIVGYDVSGIQPSRSRGGGFREVVLEDVLKMFAERAIVELIKLPSKRKLNKIAIASTTDLEADKIIHALIKGKKKLTFPKEKNVIKPLYLFLDKEVLLYAKLRNLKFKKVKESTNKISKFIDELEKTHPEVKQAIVSSWLGNESKKK